MHFFYRLNAPRIDFHLTMTENEQRVMGEHMTYWSELFNKGYVVVYGPVFDPSGVYGMAVLELNTKEEADTIKTNDPGVTSGICTGVILEMQAGMVRKKDGDILTEMDT